MGGMISLELAAQAPERVRSLSLLVTTRGKFTPHPRANAPMFKSVVSRNRNMVAKSILKLLYPDDCLTSNANGLPLGEVLKAYHRHELQHRAPPSLVGAMGQYMAVKTHFVSDQRLELIRDAGFPILIVGGNKDIVLPLVESVTLMERLQADHVKALLFQDGGHGVCIQFMEEVADALADTFARSSL